MPVWNFCNFFILKVYLTAWYIILPHNLVVDD